MPHFSLLVQSRHVLDTRNHAPANTLKPWPVSKVSFTSECGLPSTTADWLVWAVNCLRVPRPWVA